MKPCLQNRKQIALMTLEFLDPPEAARLREHLQSCAGCRAYFDELLQIQVKLTAPKMEETLSTETFHRKLSTRLKQENAPSGVGNFFSAFRAWRTAMALAGAAAVILGIFWAVQNHSPSPAPVSAVAPMVSTETISSDSPPTAGNYHMVANQSLDKLDELLNRQGNRNPQRGPIYDASGRSLAGVLN